MLNRRKKWRNLSNFFHGKKRRMEFVVFPIFGEKKIEAFIPKKEKKWKDFVKSKKRTAAASKCDKNLRKKSMHRSFFPQRK